MRLVRRDRTARFCRVPSHVAQSLRPPQSILCKTLDITISRPRPRPRPSSVATHGVQAMPAIPAFLVPRGLPSARSLRRLHARTADKCAFSTSRTKHSDHRGDNPRVLEKPDKFRPPSHPARRVVQTRNGRVMGAGNGPVNYPGPKLSEQEKEEKRTKQYPHMFPPEGTVMHRFLTSRWIHVWISMGVLTSLATFTFTTNFKSKSPFAHLLPPWSGLIWHPVDTISQALSVYRMDVQHNSMLTREKRLQRVEDAEKRRRYRVAHGLEEDISPAAPVKPEVDDQSPVAVVQGVDGQENKPVKKWFGIW